MKNKIYNIIVLGFFLGGCISPPIPEVKSQAQRVTLIETEELKKVERLAKHMNLTNQEPIYIYVESDGGVNESGGGYGEIPEKMRRQINSILMDFSPKVKVVDSSLAITQLIALNPDLLNNIYTLNGAITMYDKDIMSQSASFDFGIDFGGGKGEGSSDNSNKDKDSLSILGMDFYLKDTGGFLSYKSSSKIDIRKTTKGYNFGISLNNASIGASAYKSIKDGIGLSTRKLLQESMYNLIYQVSKDQ